MTCTGCFSPDCEDCLAKALDYPTHISLLDTDPEENSK